jgi:uncharacterized protein YjdB
MSLEGTTPSGNTSTQWLKILTTGGNQGLVFEEINPAFDRANHNAVSFLVWVSEATGFRFEMMNSGSGNQTVFETTLPADSANKWSTLTFEVPLTVTSDLTKFVFKTKSAETAKTFYLDDISFVWIVKPTPTKIEIAADNTSTLKGKKIGLSLNFTPTDADQTVTFTSLDAGFATVSSNGEVSSTGTAGSARISVISDLDPNVGDTVTVTFNEPDTSYSRNVYNYDRTTKLPSLGSADIIADIVVNPVKNTDNNSDSVCMISYAPNKGWLWINFDAFNMNDFTEVRMKVLKTTADAAFKLRIGLNGGKTSAVELPASGGILANTWTELVLPINKQESSSRQLFFQNTFTTPNDGNQYIFYIDEIRFIAGDVTKYVPVTSVAINEDAITTDDGIIDLTASFTPSIVSNDSVTWSLVNASSSISDTAIFTAYPPTLKAVRNGSVKVKATTIDGSYTAEKTITISGQKVPVNSIQFTLDTVTITTSGGTLRVDTIVNVYPADATNKNVVYSLINDTLNKISASGEVEAFMDGNLWVKAVSDSNANAMDSILVIVSNQQKVTEIIVNGAAGATAIDVNAGTLQMGATVNPAEARVKHVSWSVDDPTLASIDKNGLLQAMSDGDVVVTATAIDGSGISGNKTITLTNQISVTSVEIVGTHTITEDNVNDTIYAIVLPYNASDRSVNWTLLGNVSPDTATISILNDSTVVLKPVRNGAIKLKASPASKPSLADTIDVAISGQLVPVTSIVAKGMNDSTTIGRNDGTLQMEYTITPADADIQSVTWSLANSAASPDTCTLSASGLLTAVRNGKAIVKATVLDANNNSLSDDVEITLKNQVVEVTGVSISNTASAISNNNGMLQLTLSYYACRCRP